MTRILSLDPGISTGYSLLECSNSHHTITALDYGVIALLHAGDGGLVLSVAEWLEEFCRRWPGFRGSGNEIIFEESILSYRLKTRQEVQEVRGAIRAWCETNKPMDYRGYKPEEWRSGLGLSLKGNVKREARVFVQRCLGYQPNGADHGWDALAIGIAHAVGCGYWRLRLGPGIPLERAVGAAQTRLAQKTGDSLHGIKRVPQQRAGAQVRMTQAELREYLGRGGIE